MSKKNENFKKNAVCKQQWDVNRDLRKVLEQGPLQLLGYV